MERPVRFTKLDMYDYELVTDSDGLVTNVIVYTDTSNDIVIADISSEITASEGYIYVEGHYMQLIVMRPFKLGNRVGVNIHVNEI